MIIPHHQEEFIPEMHQHQKIHQCGSLHHLIKEKKIQ